MVIHGRGSSCRGWGVYRSALGGAREDSHGDPLLTRGGWGVVGVHFAIFRGSYLPFLLAIFNCAICAFACAFSTLREALELSILPKNFGDHDSCARSAHRCFLSRRSAKPLGFSAFSAFTCQQLCHAAKHGTKEKKKNVMVSLGGATAARALPPPPHSAHKFARISAWL